MCRKRLISRILLAAMLTLPALSMTEPDDAVQPVHVEADTAELNQTTGVGVYRGDVRVTQGTMVLIADQVTVIAPGWELQKLVAQSATQGGRATFRKLTDVGDEIIAHAHRIEYEPDKGRIMLLGNAALQRAADRFSAERIVYYINRQIVDAGDPHGEGRVEMTLVPEEGAESADAQ